MTPDEMRDWLIAEMEKEGGQYQEAKRKGWDSLRTTHFARVDMIVRTLWHLDLADQHVASTLAQRFLGEHEFDPSEASEDPDS